MNTKIDTKKLGATLALATVKDCDFVIGWKAGRDPAVQEAVAKRNQREIDAYAAQLLAEFEL